MKTNAMNTKHFVLIAMASVALSPAIAWTQANQAQPQNQTAVQSQPLTLRQAEQIALRNHPRILVAGDVAAASEAQVTQARAAYYPNVSGNLTGVDAETNSRVAAGALNNPVIYERFAEGITASQLVTDFGRTHELVKSSKLHAEAEQERVTATKADVLLKVDQAFFAALKAQAVLTVAQETVRDRQLVCDQVTELEKNQIKSGLDVSFANVDLAQAQLLLIQAQNDLDASFANLSEALGYSDERVFVLQEQSLPTIPPSNLPDSIQQALRDRPELISQRLDTNSAHSYATAQRDLWLPSLSAVGVAGLIPFRQNTLSSRYAAAGFNLNIPLFNGHTYGALQTEAKEQANAQDAYLTEIQNLIVRDVRTAWLDANSAYQRLSVTQQLLAQANLSADLANSRYKLGLSSIVELSQAQLSQTQAQIAQVSAKYDYEAQLSALDYQTGGLH